MKKSDESKKRENKLVKLFNEEYAQGFREGQEWALQTSLWRHIDAEMPKVGQRVVFFFRTKMPNTNVWIDSFVADKYDGKYIPDNCFYWMQIPPLPNGWDLYINRGASTPEDEKGDEK